MKLTKNDVIYIAFMLIAGMLLVCIMSSKSRADNISIGLNDRTLYIHPDKPSLFYNYYDSECKFFIFCEKKLKTFYYDYQMLK